MSTRDDAPTSLLEEALGSGMLKEPEPDHNTEAVRLVADKINDTQLMQQVSDGISVLQRAVHSNAIDKGFWDRERDIGMSLALIHSEVSEALEAVRKPATIGKLPGIPNFAEELADALIRLLDLAESEGIDLGEVAIMKARYNRGREHMHGKTV